jgi:hypothetical protein
MQQQRSGALRSEPHHDARGHDVSGHDARRCACRCHNHRRMIAPSTTISIGRARGPRSHRTAVLLVWCLGLVLPGLPVVHAGPPEVDKSVLRFHDPEPLTRSLEGTAQLTALSRAYPDRIGPVVYREGDWAIEVDGTWIYWANGRLLPRKARHDWHRYTRFPLYPYTPGPLEVPTLDAQQEARLRLVLEEREINPPRRHNGFAGGLYGVRTAGQARNTMVTTHLLGHPVRVHPMVREPLERVQADIDAEFEESSELQAFQEELYRVEGFFWRPIAGTHTVSYHGYGVAVDLIPRSYYRQSAYWRWSRETGIEDWWNIPLERRWTVPELLVEIFERHGFVWGGRWLFFDAIHFEYRPELFLLKESDRGPVGAPAGRRPGPGPDPGPSPSPSPSGAIVP